MSVLTGISAISASTAAEYNTTDNSDMQEYAVSSSKSNIIRQVWIQHIMGIKEVQLILSPNVNVIMGENSTGKTAVLKAIYSLLAGYNEGYKYSTQQKKISCIERKIKHVYRPDDSKIGNIVNKNEKKAVIRLTFSDQGVLSAEFGKEASEHIRYDEEIEKSIIPQIVYIPTKEMISIHDFVSLYDKYEISIEEMYADVARQLLMPEQKNISDEEKKIIGELVSLMEGTVQSSNGKFYIVRGDGVKLEMGLVSEGYRKIATLARLIANGSLRKGSILLMDEPETNMNPKLTEKLVKAMTAISKMGVQVIVTTHDYFISQEFGLDARYNKTGLEYSFISLYKGKGEINVESSHDLYQIENNSIMDQFDDLYERENVLGWANLQG